MPRCSAPPAGPAAIGGSLTVSSGRFYPPGTSGDAQTPLDVTLTVTQGGSTAPSRLYPAGQTAVGHAVLDASGTPIAGAGIFRG